MATITGNITGVTRTQVSVKYTITKNESNVDITPTYAGQKKRVETINSVTMSGGFSSSKSSTAISDSLTGDYNRITPSSHTLSPQAITLTVNYTYQTATSRQMSTYNTRMPSTGYYYTNNINDMEDFTYGSYEYRCYSFNSNDKNYMYMYYYMVYEIWYQWYWDGAAQVATATYNVGNYYKSPAEFTFTNCLSNNTWRVDLGLSDLITNIYVFPRYATHWKAWKYQKPPDKSCPDFVKGDLTASNLNDIYYYVNGTKPYSSGDIVAASMFNNLASAINVG